jgi:hypothetical protein
MLSRVFILAALAAPTAAFSKSHELQRRSLNALNDSPLLCLCLCQWPPSIASPLFRPEPLAPPSP